MSDPKKFTCPSCGEELLTKNRYVPSTTGSHWYETTVLDVDEYRAHLTNKHAGVTRINGTTLARADMPLFAQTQTRP